MESNDNKQVSKKNRIDINQELVKISSGLVHQYFDVEIPKEEVNEVLLLELLTKRINHLLDYDFQTLLNAMYRIDVDETKFKQIVSQEPAGIIGASLASLVLDRMIQKAEMRLKYQ